MQLTTTTYTEQRARLPRSGRHIVAQFDAAGVVVYQAYRPEIGHFAATHGYFGGDRLIVPTERIYPMTDPQVAARLQLSDNSALGQSSIDGGE